MLLKTYLSMVKDEAKHINEEHDRHLVLSAVFRSSNTGLLKDDGPNLMDLITKLGKKASS